MKNLFIAVFQIFASLVLAQDAYHNSLDAFLQTNYALPGLTQ